MKIKVSVATDKIGSKCEREVEIDDGELENYEGTERDELIEEIAREMMFEMIEWNWEIL